jgi:hypothetical protein
MLEEWGESETRATDASDGLILPSPEMVEYGT